MQTVVGVNNLSAYRADSLLSCNGLSVNCLCSVLCVYVYLYMIISLQIPKFLCILFLLFWCFEIIILMFAWKIFESTHSFRFICMGFSFNKAISLIWKIRNLLLWNCLCINATLQCFLWSYYYMLSPQTDCELINHKEHLLGLTGYCQSCGRAKYYCLQSPSKTEWLLS